MSTNVCPQCNSKHIEADTYWYIYDDSIRYPWYHCQSCGFDWINDADAEFKRRDENGRIYWNQRESEENNGTAKS